MGLSPIGYPTYPSTLMPQEFTDAKGNHVSKNCRIQMA